MLSLDRFSNDSRCNALEFLVRKVLLQPGMKLGNRLNLAGLSLSDIVSILEGLGVERHRTTDHQ